MKRTLSVVLSIVMVLSVFAVCAVSAEAVTFECGVGKTKQLEDRNYWGDGSTTTKTWWSSNTSIAKVQSQSGATCQIYGVSEGTVTIYCQTNAQKWVGDRIYGYMDSKSTKKEYEVKVVAVGSKPAANNTSSSNTKASASGTKKITVKNKNTIVKNKKKKGINVKSATLVKGKKLKLKLKKAKASKVKWKSSKKSVVSVTKKGKITAKKVGTAKITAKYKGKKYKCKIKVINKTSTKTVANTSTAKKNAQPVIKHTVSEAFSILKDYIVDNGIHRIVGEGESTYTFIWESGIYTYYLYYEYNQIRFICRYTENGMSYDFDLKVIEDNETYCEVNFDGDDPDFADDQSMRLSCKKTDFVNGKVLNFAFGYTNGNHSSSMPKQSSNIVWKQLPVFNNYIIKNVGVNIQELGFVNYK